jgi:hypothetical protein
MKNLLGLVLLAAILGGAYVTRPNEGVMQEAANVVLRDPNNLSETMEGFGATLAGDRVFNDYYVASHYTVTLDSKPVVECWGAFTKTNCTRTKAST